ncbi:MAG TPA: hypothetical protein VGJ26_13275 [Pirellulales bacterium]
MTPTTPPSRWFQFGLRTMFVVVFLLAIFLGWLAWTLRMIHARRAVLESVSDRHGDFWTLGRCQEGLGGPKDVREAEARELATQCSIPFWRKWLGDEPVALIFDTFGTEVDRSEQRRLFPEAIAIQQFPGLEGFQIDLNNLEPVPIAPVLSNPVPRAIK